ncbi:MAG: hypothetical protein ACXWC3_00260 [Burkholderiales bacterium]
MIARSSRMKLIATAAALSLVGGCQQFEPTKQDVGMATGAILGSAVELATARALEISQTGRPTAWRNPDTGHA